MTNSYNLQDLFNKQWGKIAGSPKQPKFDDINKTAEPAKDPAPKISDQVLVNFRSPSKYYARDMVGREIFMPVTFKDVHIGTKKDLLLPYCWVSFQANKRIVETPLTDRRGTVNELISVDDYKISIKGFVIGYDGSYPEDDIKELETLFNRNEALTLDCPMTDIFLLSENHTQGADKVIILDLKINEAQGNQHVRGFEMSLKTDQILELEYLGD